MNKPEILNLPPEDAVEHFRAKGYHIGFDWRDTAAGEHLRSFTVAKVAKLDILEDIRQAVDEALAEGKTFAWFEDELEPMLRRKGWWGRRNMIDPVTGQIRNVQLGSARRLRIIFDTNLRMAYAHGRWQAIERLKEARPYLRYVAIQDARTRPEHLAWHGTILPVDHPWWNTHYPPCGWRCRCQVQQLSEDDLERYGYSVSKHPPPGSQKTRPWLDKRNEKIIQVPVGIDPGFAHNVGKIDLTRDTANRLIKRIDRAPDNLARAAIGHPWDMPLFHRHLTGASHTDWPIAVLSPTILDTLGGQSKTVRLSGETAAKQTSRHPQYEPGDYHRIQHILDEGEWFKINERNLIGFLQGDNQIWRVAIKRTGKRAETYLTTFHRAQKRDLNVARNRYKPIKN